MKAAISDGKGKIWVQEVAMPQPTEYQCLCRIEACATCTGTDKTLVSGKMPWAQDFPAIMGHESYGTVVECGKKVRNIQPGDHFLRPAAAYWDTHFDGLASWMGGYAEYGLVTDVKALKEDHPDAPLSSYMQYQQMIPRGLEISAVDATMLITLKEVYSFVRDLGIRPAHKVAVLGAGSVALTMTFFAKLAGAKQVVAIARREGPLQLSRQAGADDTMLDDAPEWPKQLAEITGGGADFVLDGVGNTALLTAAARGLAEYGSLCPYAVNLGNPLNPAEIQGPAHWRYFNCPPDEVSAHPFLMSMVRMKTIPFSLFYSHIMPLDQISQGFQMLFAKTAMKIVFKN